MDAYHVGKLANDAEKMGITVQELVISVVQRKGSINGAARELGVRPNTIEYHLRKAGLKLTVKTEITLEKVS